MKTKVEKERERNLTNKSLNYRWENRFPKKVAVSLLTPKPKEVSWEKVKHLTGGSTISQLKTLHDQQEIKSLLKFFSYEPQQIDPQSSNIDVYPII